MTSARSSTLHFFRNYLILVILPIYANIIEFPYNMPIICLYILTVYVLGSPDLRALTMLTCIAVEWVSYKVRKTFQHQPHCKPIPAIRTGIGLQCISNASLRTFISSTNKKAKNENALPPGESDNNYFLSTSFQHHCLFPAE